VTSRRFFMLAAIKQFFENHIAPEKEGGDLPEHAVRLAVAALLFEMMRMDEETTDQEYETVGKILTERFELSEAETARLIALAEEEAADVTDYYQFTALINKHFSPRQKGELLEQLWRVAYADGHLDKYEEHLVRKLAELLHVPHSRFIAAKHRAVKLSGG